MLVFYNNVVLAVGFLSYTNPVQICPYVSTSSIYTVRECAFSYSESFNFVFRSFFLFVCLFVFKQKFADVFFYKGTGD